MFLAIFYRVVITPSIVGTHLVLEWKSNPSEQIPTGYQFDIFAFRIWEHLGDFFGWNMAHQRKPLEDFYISWGIELHGCVMFHCCGGHMNTEASTSGLGQNRPIPAGKKTNLSLHILSSWWFQAV